MKTEIKWGIIFSLFMLVWLWMEFILGFHTKYIAYHPYFTNLALIPSILIIRAGMKEKKRLLGGEITYMQAMKSGLMMTLVITLLSPLSQYIFHHFINPDFFHSMIDYAVKNGKATPEQANQYFNFKNYMIESTVGSLFIGVAIVSVSALVLRTKKPSPEV